MGATAHKIASAFIGAAQREPGNRSEIFRKAAYTFVGLAQDPANARSSSQLVQLGLQFADAAHSARPPTMDDFVDLLRETETSYNEVGDDPQDLIARRREIHDDRTKPDPGHISIAPSTFNKDATLGRSAVIKWAPTQDDIVNGIVQSQNVAFWQGIKKEAQAITIDISLGFLPASADSDALTPNNVRPYAEIEFGSDGNRTKFRCDVGQGKRLTVVGNYVSVSVAAGAPRAGAPSPAITAGASIGCFAAPSPAPTILTLYVDGVDVGASGDWLPIPLKAVQLLPVQMGNMALGGVFAVQFADLGGGSVGQTYATMSATSWPPTIPIPGDAAYVRIFNQGPTPFPVLFRLPFQLAV